jgi:hypothetical protein
VKDVDDRAILGNVTLTGADVRLNVAGLRTGKIGEKQVFEMSTSWHF